MSGNAEVRTLCFTVSDTGIGMSREFLDKAFDLFSQEDASSTSRYGGSGISLAVTRRQVNLMKGTITADSRQHEGSVFTVTLTLPLAGEKEAAAEPQAVPEDLRGRRVLIAEDIDENAEIVADLLELEGMETERAGDGQAALRMFRDSAPFYYDIILMDMRMPVMDGLEAARAIRALARADAKTVPIIALTANAYPSDVEQSLAAGMNEHLGKPVDAEELYEKISAWIRKTQEGGAAL